jgi:alpha-glucosidase
MIDFAAANGFCGVLIEGWNKGWDGDWFADGKDFSFTEAYPDFDLPKIAAYAKKRGVKIIGHHETSGNIAHYEEQMEAGFDLYQRYGIDAVKTGYVADAGGLKVKGPDGKITYEWHEGQASARHHVKVLTEAAKRHIAINSHEPIKDTGLRRTYPNWVSREGARGMEFNAWGGGQNGFPGNGPEHEATLVFTRMLAGPMDYTPGVVSLMGKDGQRIPSTLAKQLGLYVVLYSPLQMAADLPEHYAAQPEAFRFIKQVPVDWAESITLAGEPGDYAVTARLDRHSDNWFLGAAGGIEPREIDVPLAFLTPGKRYTAEIWRDGAKADWKTAPFDMVVEKRSVTSADRLALRLAAGGGAAVRFTPEGKGK